MAAELLIDQGHKVVLHARSAARADETRKKIAGVEDIVVGDLDDRFHETGIDEPSIHGTRSVLADSSFENG